MALASVLLAFYWFAPTPKDGPGRSNVILISLDTVRADHLGCYGHPFIQTPSLDQLATDGVRFADVTSAAPTTLASHTSIMTGKYPHTHGAPRNGFVVHPQNVMLAETLKAAGFSTAAVIGSFALDRRFGFDQGFDDFDQTFDLEAVTDGVDQNQRRADRVTDAALAVLDKPASQPRFLFVHYFDAHAPYDPPASFDALYAAGRPACSGSLAEIASAVDEHHAADLEASLGQQRVLSEGLTLELLQRRTAGPLGMDEGLEARYCGEISYLDSHVGRLIESIKLRGLYENSLIVVTSDHGETMWEHADVWNHGLWVYDTTVRVPLIVKLPEGRQRGRVIDEPVSSIDIVPTVLRLLDVAEGAKPEGVDLSPLLVGERLERGVVFCEATQPYKGIESSEGWRNAMKPKCVRSGRWKYIAAPYLKFEELFDLGADPGERANLLAGAAPEAEVWKQVSQFRELLKNWHQSASPLPSEFDATHYEESLERLRSLGYVGEGDD